MLIMGAPGSGKGTQAELLVQRFGIPSISTGAMLRAAIAEGSAIGRQAQLYIDDGKLVPDSVMIDLVLSRIAQADCENGYILDGFPRTLAQAIAMDKSAITIDTVLMIELPDGEIIDRIAGRRVCGKCGATYHIKHKPSQKGELCELCGGKLGIRADDTEETIKKRLDIYHEVTAPVIAFYKDKGILVTIQSVSGVAETSKQVIAALGVGV